MMLSCAAGFVSLVALASFVSSPSSSAAAAFLAPMGFVPGNGALGEKGLLFEPASSLFGGMMILTSDISTPVSQ